ncbi:hypothetical protein PIB30_054630 [Stylosanthes scabra]|uniref:Putative plant transposon protein domain-containing protein n=1 Tax=Stylosanthes scabra TaxID=79078 RepID=A0ABU6VHD0_9FABA|nr:hypothetical protein [Stylosanthes scabra]
MHIASIRHTTSSSLNPMQEEERLAAPRTSISKLLVQEFYANAAVFDEEAARMDELPYKSFVRGKEVDFSPRTIRRVMRFKRETAGAETDYNTRKAIDQRLDEVLRDLCIPRATWKMSSSQPAVPIQLRRTDLQPLARGWQEFIIHSLVPTGNKSEVTTTRAILIHSIMQGEDNSKDSGIELYNSKEDGNNKPRYESQYHEDLQGIEETLSRMQFFQQTFDENMQKSQADYMEEVKQLKEKQEQIYNHNQRFHSQIWQEQEKLAKEIQEVRRSQLAQAVANNQRLEAERNMQLALDRQGRDIVEIRKQVNLWTNNVSSKEAYACWTQQQANPNLSEIPITQIPDIMRTNLEKGRPCSMGSSSPIMEHPPPLKLIPKSRFHCGLHLPLLTSVHLILHLISYKVV